MNVDYGISLHFSKYFKLLIYLWLSFIFLCYLFNNIMNTCELKPNPRIGILLLYIFLSISPATLPLCRFPQRYPVSWNLCISFPCYCVLVLAHINMFNTLLHFIFSLNSFFDTRVSHYLLSSRTYSPHPVPFTLYSYTLHRVQLICFSIAV